MSRKSSKPLTYIAVCTMLFALVLGTTTAQAQTVAPTIASITVVGGTGVQYSYGDRFWGRCPSTDGSVLAVGDCSSIDGDLAGIRKGNPPPQDYTDALIVRFAADSSVVWKHCFGGNSSDIAQDAVQTSDSGYVVVGSTNSLDVDLSGIRRDTSVNYHEVASVLPLM